MPSKTHITLNQILFTTLRSYLNHHVILVLPLQRIFNPLSSNSVQSLPFHLYSVFCLDGNSHGAFKLWYTKTFRIINIYSVCNASLTPPLPPLKPNVVWKSPCAHDQKTLLSCFHDSQHEQMLCSFINGNTFPDFWNKGFSGEIGFIQLLFLFIM